MQWITNEEKWTAPWWLMMIFFIRLPWLFVLLPRTKMQIFTTFHFERSSCFPLRVLWWIRQKEKGVCVWESFLTMWNIGMFIGSFDILTLARSTTTAIGRRRLAGMLVTRAWIVVESSRCKKNGKRCSVSKRQYNLHKYTPLHTIVIKNVNSLHPLQKNRSRWPSRFFMLFACGTPPATRRIFLLSITPVWIVCEARQNDSFR